MNFERQDRLLLEDRLIVPGSGGPLVLVVEDHDFQRETLVDMLEELGVQGVLQASDGRAALEIIREVERPFDLILTDIDMPVMDGMALIRQLATDHVTSALAITSSLDRPLRESIEAMTDAFGITLLGSLEKPVSPHQLARLLQRVRDDPRAPSGHSVATAYTRQEVSQALADDQFVPFFQPTVELATGRVVGAEALARWRHPGDGLVSPASFISLMESSDLIGELTWQMLAQSAAHCVEWRRLGLDLKVSVNLSVQSLGIDHFADAVAFQVNSQGLEPRHMTLEVTESGACSDVGKMLENLARLRIKGFGLSIDDFGTGYASMQQLTRIPFTELKVDQSFVMRASRQMSSRMVLASSLEMARHLGIVSVAEGAATEAEWEMLKRSDCDLAQGFYIAQPMPADEFAEWVQTRNG